MSEITPPINHFSDLTDEQLLQLIPDTVLFRLRFSIAQIRQWNDYVDRLRATDQFVGGGSRYTWESTNGQQRTFEFEFAQFEKFKAIAQEKGIDGDRVLQLLGFTEPTQLTEDEQFFKWQTLIHIDA